MTTEQPREPNLSLPTTDHIAPPPDVPYVPRRSSVTSIVAELWEARDLVVQFMLRDINIRYAQAIMGFAWALLMPILIVGAGLVFRVVLSTLANSPIQGASVASLTAKAVPWAFFSGAVTMATQSLLAHANLIGKVYFPRESIPVASVMAQCTDLAVSLLIVAVVVPVFGVPVHSTMLWAPLMLVLLVLFTMGWALILSCANLFFRDVKYILQVALNFGVFATPVFFEPQMLGKRGAAIMLSLPLSPFIQAMDVSIIRGHSLLTPLTVQNPKGAVVTIWDPWMLGYATTLALGAFFVGLLVFRRTSTKFAEMA